MARDPVTTERLRNLVSKLISLTEEGTLRWERQLGSAHRYARWRNNLLILGPGESPTDSSMPRYLFITPFDSPACMEINSSDEELGREILKLVTSVETATKGESPVDPFALTDEVLSRITS